MAERWKSCRPMARRPFPPPPLIAPVIHMAGGGDGQIWASAAGASTTPKPPQRSLVQAGSAVLSITNAATASSGSATHSKAKNNTPRKGNVPKQKFPDFSRPYSKDNAYLPSPSSSSPSLSSLLMRRRLSRCAATSIIAPTPDSSHPFSHSG
jgi:hypothetical protein